MTPAPDGPPAGPVRTAALPGGRVLTVRRTRPTDADGLARLYDGLDDDDRYRRFFSLYRPDRATIEQWAADNERGRLRLAALVGDEGGDRPPELIGDALCVPLPDGDGEFALTVAAGWRGWIGAYLLDALAEVAADAGIRSIQADILHENRRMLAVVQSRGYAVLAHPDFSEVRVTTGTSPTTPDWPGPHDRPRILIEARSSRSPLHNQLGSAGFSVITCPGPGRRCPALAGQPCPLAAGADAILFALPAADPLAGPLAAAHGRLHAGVPLCVVDRAGEERAGWPVGAVHLDAATLVEDLASGPLAGVIPARAVPASPPP